MEIFEPCVQKVSSEHQIYYETLLQTIQSSYPELEPVVKWNQPMFTHHGTFIIGFSTAKNHISIAPEAYTLEKFKEKITQAGYEQTKMLFKIKFKDEVNYDLLKEIIDFNIKDKKDVKTFWRSEQ